jgi:hypothetical protein
VGNGDAEEEEKEKEEIGRKKGGKHIKSAAFDFFAAHHGDVIYYERQKGDD